MIVLQSLRVSDTPSQEFLTQLSFAEESPELVCPVCAVGLEGATALVEHVKTAHWVGLTCPRDGCRERLPDAAALDSHLQGDHVCACKKSVSHFARAASELAREDRDTQMWAGVPDAGESAAAPLSGAAVDAAVSPSLRSVCAGVQMAGMGRPHQIGQASAEREPGC